MKNLIEQAIKFVGFSSIGWVLDFITFTALGFISSNLILNNSISSWVGVTFVFIFATRKIFKDNHNIPIKYKYIIYILYQVILIFFISKVLDVVNVFLLENISFELMHSFSAILSKIIVTPITMVLNFIVMKLVIEKL